MPGVCLKINFPPDTYQTPMIVSGVAAAQAGPGRATARADRCRCPRAAKAAARGPRDAGVGTKEAAFQAKTRSWLLGMLLCCPTGVAWGLRWCSLFLPQVAARDERESRWFQQQTAPCGHFFLVTKSLCSRLSLLWHQG